jgi:nicotinate-nucleotide adenylyltransferase
VQLGIFGGSFDPPHVGHLLAAADALEHLQLDRIIFVPNCVQPLKGGAVASPEERLQMLGMATAGESRFEVSPVEVVRKGLSYTVDTLEEFTRLHTGARLFFLAGADAVHSFPEWKDGHRILELATFALLTRTVQVTEADAPRPRGSRAQPGIAGKAAPLKIEGAVTVPTRTVDVSSTEVRGRVAAGKTIKGFVAESVERFIMDFGLYKRVME